MHLVFIHQDFPAQFGHIAAYLSHDQAATRTSPAARPVREMITPGETGLLADFFDVDGFVQTAHAVLDDPPAYRPLGQAGTNLIRARYSLDVCLPQMLELYEQVRQGA